MTQLHHQNHATWDCKYHVVFIPKYRKKAIFGVIKRRASATCSTNWRGVARARSRKGI